MFAFAGSPFACQEADSTSGIMASSVKVGKTHGGHKTRGWVVFKGRLGIDLK